MLYYTAYHLHPPSRSFYQKHDCQNLVGRKRRNPTVLVFASYENVSGRSHFFLRQISIVAIFVNQPLLGNGRLTVIFFEQKPNALFIA